MLLISWSSTSRDTSCVDTGAVQLADDRIKLDEAVRAASSCFRSEVKSRTPEVLESIRSARELTKETEDKLTTLLESFVKTFV